MATIKCSNCGAEMPEDTVVCTRCGILVDRKKREGKKQPVPEAQAKKAPVRAAGETVRNRTEGQPLNPRAGQARSGGTPKNTSAMRQLQSLSAALADRAEDDELKSVLSKLAEDFRFSDPVSTKETGPLENGLAVRIAELRRVLESGDRETVINLCDSIADSLKERNRVCAQSK